MSATALPGPSGAAIVAALKASGVGFIAAVPDIWTSAGLLWPIAADDGFRLIRLCKEDEGISICSGLAYAGKRAVLLMQSTGLLDSMNALRAIAVEYEQPVCMLVGLLSKEPDRAPADSAQYGVRIVPGILEVMGIDYVVVEGPDDVGAIVPAIGAAYARSRPCAVLIGRQVEA